MFCDSCGAFLPDNSLFCSTCGAKLGNRISAAATPTAYAPDYNYNSDTQVSRPSFPSTPVNYDPSILNVARIALICGIVSIILSTLSYIIGLFFLVRFSLAYYFTAIILDILALSAGIVAIVLSVKARKFSFGAIGTAGMVCGIIGVVLSGFSLMCCSACYTCFPSYF